MENQSETSSIGPDSRPLKRAAVAIVRKGDCFLAIRRSKTVRAPGKICFPGGGVEMGESLPQALIREMLEELRVEVKPVRQVWQSHSVRGFELNWWLAELQAGAMPDPNLDEVESWSWMSREEMESDVDLLDSNAAFFDALKDGQFEL